jgi:cysteine desulfurase
MAMSEFGVCASGGSACHSGSLQPSGVLLAMGIEPDLARTAIRFSLSRMTTDQEVDRVVELLPDLVRRLRNTSSP